MNNKKLHTKHRTYFFNTFKNEGKNDLVEVIESQILKDGTFKRNRIVIFNKDLKEFITKLQKFTDET